MRFEGRAKRMKCYIQVVSETQHFGNCRFIIFVHRIFRVAGDEHNAAPSNARAGGSVSLAPQAFVARPPPFRKGNSGESHYVHFSQR
jgi:hypothetical protein